MGVREILAALTRRWYIVVVGLAVAIAGGWYVYDSNPPDYAARGLVLLLPPEGNTPEAVGSNPFLSLGGLELTARVVVATYSSTSFSEEVEAISPDAEVEVSMDESTRGGVIAIDVKDKGEEAALSMLDYVTGTVSERLQGLQDEVGVQESSAVTSMVLAMDTVAEPDYQSLIRLLVIVVGGSIAGALIIALILDLALERRRRRGSYNFWNRRGGALRRAATAPGADEDQAQGPETRSSTPDSAVSVGVEPRTPETIAARLAVPGRRVGHDNPTK